MTRRRLHLILALLLPLLALRALVPVGYMPVAEGQGLRLVLCDANLADRNTPHHDGAHHHDAAHDDSAHHGHPGSPGDCPFAHAAFSAPPPHLASSAIAPVPELRYVVRSFQNLQPLTGPPRQASARAPPLSIRNSLV